MKIDFSNIQRLALKRGPVETRDASRAIKTIQDNPESIDAVDGAEVFRFQKVWYNRLEFRKLLAAKLHTD